MNDGGSHGSQKGQQPFFPPIEPRPQPQARRGGLNPDALPFIPIPVPPPLPPQPRRPLNPNAVPFVPQQQRRSRAYMYTPFGGEEALHSALGENMVRVRKGKDAHGLLAPSHQVADQMEQLRQQKLTQWGAELRQARTTLDRHAQRGVDADNLRMARLKRIADGTAAPVETLSATMAAHRDRLDTLQTHKALAQGTVALHQERFNALEQTRILNTSANLYPQLFPDPPLQHLARKDKLYVLGHGAPNDSRLHGKADGSQPMDTGALVQHLKDAGLPRDFKDLRLTACQGVPVIENENAQRLESLKGTYLVPSLYNATRKDFPQMDVTGYAGNGVTFPYGSDHHQRTAPDDGSDRVRRKPATVRYPALK